MSGLLAIRTLRRTFRVADGPAAFIRGTLEGTKDWGDSEMADEAAIKFAIEYLEKSFLDGKPADLVEMLHYVDVYERVGMVLEEVQEVLKRQPSVHLQRVDRRIIFARTDGDREIGEEDLERNVQMHHQFFWDKYRELQNHEKVH